MWRTEKIIKFIESIKKWFRHTNLFIFIFLVKELSIGFIAFNMNEEDQKRVM